jgi:hypothetical protein
MILWVQNPGLLDLGLLASMGHTVVERKNAAQVLVAGNSVPTGADNKNIIMLYLEPPLGDGYSTVYRMARSFRAFGSLVELGIPNSFPLTLDPIAYPYGFNALVDRRRSDTTLRQRRIFYAGTKVGHPPGGDGDYGRVALYGVRNAMVDGLRGHGVDVYAEGNGWPQSSRSHPNWDVVKGRRIDEVGADFHLCMENSRLEHYVSEKIHHGFQSDRVVLYLGCSRIHEHVPSGAFINLNRFFDPVTKAVRYKDIADLILGMSQQEYDRILGTARRWRNSDMLQERFEIERERVTREVLRFL